MSTAGWLALLVAVAALWIASVIQSRRRLEACERELARLKASSGGLADRLARRARAEDELLAAIREAVLRVDRRGRVLGANPRARELFAMPEGFRFPAPMLTLHRDPDWIGRLDRALANLPESCLLPVIEVHGRWLEPRLHPLGRDEALLLCMDITDRYRLEQQRRRFLANLIHDLKTPLTSLLGYARSLAEFGDDPEFRADAAKIIAEEAHHLNRMVEALLDLDRIESMPPRSDARADAAAVLRTVTEALKPRLDAAGMTCRLEVPAGPVEVAMGADDLERVAGNLIENAIRYAADGGWVGVCLRKEAGGMVALIVEDAGEGVPERELPRLAERFYRVDKARARNTGGHGLGLAIVRELAIGHGGRLELENREPTGLRARVLLPAAQAN